MKPLLDDIAEALGLRMRPPPDDGVVPGYLEPRYARIGAIVSLGKNPGPLVSAALARCLATECDEAVREAAMFVLGEMADSPERRLALGVATFDGDEAIRHSALHLLTHADITYAVPFAARLADDPDPTVAELARSVLASAPTGTYPAASSGTTP